MFVETGYIFGFSDTTTAKEGCKRWLYPQSDSYKGRPLVRCGNDIYYGSMHDPYVVYLQVLTTKKEGNADVADKVHIVLLSTDESKPLPARIVRQANKAGGLFNALTFGDIMLRNQLKNEKK